MGSIADSQYNQEVKNECRSRLIEHAVRCLTEERQTSACVKKDHVRKVWDHLCKSKELNCFLEQERCDIEEEITQWEKFHDSQIQTRKPSDLRVCYLAGENPINDLEVFMNHGILCQNVWAIEKDAKTLEIAWEKISKSRTRNIRLFKGDFKDNLKEFQGQFDIIYFDACGSLPSRKQNTLKAIGYVFLYNKLTSPGVLITNFSFPPKQQEQGASQDQERERLGHLTREYLKCRLEDTKVKENPDADVHQFKPSDEEYYSDYVTYQVIDTAYMFIPAQRMFSSNKQSLWDQIFVEQKDFFNYARKNLGHTNGRPSLCKTAEKSAPRKLASALKDCKCQLCKAWVTEIFPDWRSSKLKNEKVSSLVLTHLLSYCPELIFKFANDQFISKCLRPLIESLIEKTFSKFSDPPTAEATTGLVAGLLYGQMAYPSFPVVDKLLRLKYTARERQMFADVFVFDKCRYVYEQFPTVDCSEHAINEPKQQMVFRMVVDGLRKHVAYICHDIFQLCNVAGVNATTKGGTSSTNCHSKIPNRQDLDRLPIATRSSSLELPVDCYNYFFIAVIIGIMMMIIIGIIWLLYDYYSCETGLRRELFL